MNNARREKLKTAADFVSRAKELVDSSLDEETDALDSLPENLEGSERYTKMENAADCLEDASQNLEEALENILEAML